MSIAFLLMTVMAAMSVYEGPSNGRSIPGLAIRGVLAGMLALITAAMWAAERGYL